MKILKKITHISLRKNRLRTSITIIGIALSTALIVCMISMFTSFRTTIIDEAIARKGNYHVKYYGLSEQQADEIDMHNDIDSYYVEQTVGVSKLENPQTRNKKYIQVSGLDNSALDQLQVVEGRLPTSQNEVVIDKRLHDGTQASYQIGDTIDLQYGIRTQHGMKVNYNQGYFSDEEYTLSGEVGNYSVVGIIEEPYYSHEYAATYEVVSVLQEGDGLYNVSYLLNDASLADDFEEDVSIILERTLGESEQFPYSFRNVDLINFTALEEGGALVTLYGLLSAAILIVMIASAICIRNSFAISILEKTRMYGMLKSIGATSKQVKYSVLYEATLLGIFGVAIGLLLGIGVSAGLIAILNLPYFQDIMMMQFRFDLSYIGVVLAILLGLFTVYGSAFFTSVRASKINEIEAIRNQKEIKISQKKVKTSKLVNKILPIGARIAYKNLKRSKSQYRTTLLSIIVSVAIFIGLTSFMEIGMTMSQSYYKNSTANVMLYFDQKYEELEGMFDTLSAHESIEEASYIMQTHIVLSYAENEKLAKLVYPDTEELPEIFINTVVLEDAQFATYLESLKQQETLQDGEFILFHSEEIEENINILASQNEEYPLITNTQVAPFGVDGIGAGTYTLITDKSSYEEFMQKVDVNDPGYASYNMCFKSSNSAAFVEYAEQLDTNEYIQYLVDLDAAQEANTRMIVLLSIFLYGFICVITLVGITNIFNAIHANINLRRREFATLQSIGMSRKEFVQLQRIESILYGLKALLYGIPFGVGISYVLYIQMNQDVYPFPYKLPIQAIIISCISVIILIYVIMKISMRNIKKQNIIETIRNENI